MKTHIKFRMNITRVLNEGDEEIETTDEHYKKAADQFIEDSKDVEHELVMMDGDIIYFEMEDLDSVCDICDSYPCRCEEVE